MGVIFCGCLLFFRLGIKVAEGRRLTWQPPFVIPFPGNSRQGMLSILVQLYLGSRINLQGPKPDVLYLIRFFFAVVLSRNWRTTDRPCLPKPSRCLGPPLQHIRSFLGLTGQAIWLRVRSGLVSVAALWFPWTRPSRPDSPVLSPAY